MSNSNVIRFKDSKKQPGLNVQLRPGGRASHRFGAPDIFEHCQHHLNATAIPLSEATRLLFNRCTGLLLVQEKLTQATDSSHDADFIGRNLAKAQLALGDAVLAVHGKYHWSCLERSRRLAQLSLSDPPPNFTEIRNRHACRSRFQIAPPPLWELRTNSKAAIAIVSPRFAPVVLAGKHPPAGAVFHPARVFTPPSSKRPRLSHGEITC